eukprot:jgi/Galph1/5017/GphlegSOOS_G3598.1
MKFAHQLDRIVAESEEEYAPQYVSYRILKKDLRHKNTSESLEHVLDKQRTLSSKDVVDTSSQVLELPYPQNSLKKNRITTCLKETQGEANAQDGKHSNCSDPETHPEEIELDLSEAKFEETKPNLNECLLDKDRLTTNILFVDPKDAIFFRHLDRELEKVNSFFVPRAKALLARHEFLERQASNSKFVSALKNLKEKFFISSSQRLRANSRQCVCDNRSRPEGEPLLDREDTNDTHEIVKLSDSRDLNNSNASAPKRIQSLNSPVEIYKEALRLLQYVNVNITAFRKILKKHDKRCELSLGRQYLQLKVESQPFVHSSIAKTLEELGCRGSVLVSTVEQLPVELSNLKDFQCPICLSLLYKPMSLPCGHRFCGKCISRAILIGFHCPVCRHDYTSGVRLERKKSLERFLRQSFPEAWRRRREEVLQDERDRERMLAEGNLATNRPRLTLAQTRQTANEEDSCHVS